MSGARDLGLIGLGHWGKNLARNFDQLGVLHTLCDVREEVLKPYGADYASVDRVTDAAAVFENPEITRVAIAAPAVDHYDLARAAIEAGKDVFVEKPIALELDQAQELTAAAGSADRILMVGHLLQYHPCIREVQRLVREGGLGQLRCVTSNRLNLGRFRREENVLWSFAPHDVSVILSITGDELPEQIRCLGEAVLTPHVPDTTLTTMRLPSGVLAHIYVSWLNPFKEQKLTVVGTEGMLVFDDTKPWAEKLMLCRNYVTWTGGATPTPGPMDTQHLVVTEEEPLRAECQHFLECCATRQRPRTDGHEGVRVLQVLKAAQHSLLHDGDAATVGQRGPGTQKLKYFAHETAIVDEGASIGDGCRIWHFSHVMDGAQIGPGCSLGQNVVVSPGVTLGRNVKVQNNVSIYSGTVVEDDVFLGPSCVLTNVSNPRSQIARQNLYEPTRLKRGATVGANATVVCGTALGRYSFIAAGAVVTSDTPDYALMVGSPARRVGWMSRHGHRLEAGADGTMVCPESKYRYQEVSPEVVRCLDLAEDEPLPADERIGKVGYRDVRASVADGA